MRGSAIPVTPAQLLNTRRAVDAAPDLWTTENVIQENLMRGGIRVRNAATGRRATTRPVASVNEDIRLNKGLWVLADRMAELKRP